MLPHVLLAARTNQVEIAADLLPQVALDDPDAHRRRELEGSAARRRL